MNENQKAQEACRKAVNKAGGPAVVASLYAPTITRQAVSLWRVVPLVRVKRLSEKSGMGGHEIRPDLPELFPPPES